jgi:hypothetical protein
MSESVDSLLKLYLADELTIEQYEIRVGARMGLVADQMRLLAERKRKPPKPRDPGKPHTY